MMAVAAERSRHPATTALGHEVMIGRVEVGPLAERAGITLGLGHAPSITRIDGGYARPPDGAGVALAPSCSRSLSLLAPRVRRSRSPVAFAFARSVRVRVRVRPLVSIAAWMGLAGSALGDRKVRSGSAGSALGDRKVRSAIAGSALGLHKVRRAFAGSALGLRKVRRAFAGSALGHRICRRGHAGRLPVLCPPRLRSLHPPGAASLGVLTCNVARGPVPVNPSPNERLPGATLSP